jgi:Gpi18-like mannosyltransferase
MQQSAYAFFPLYPFTVRFTMYAFNMGFNSMALMYSIVFSILLFVFFYQFTRIFYNSEKIAFWSTLLLIVFPFNYYFSVFYAEALYLMLLMWSFLAIHKKRWPLLFLLLGLMMLSRPNGLLVLLPLFIYFIEQCYSLDPKQWKKYRLKDFLPLLSFLSVPIVLVLYGIYLKQMTGDFFALKTAQIGWCRWTTAPWQPLLGSDSWQDYVKIFYFLIFTGIAIFFIKKLPVSLNLLIWISLLAPLFYNTITQPRYIAVIFVFFMLLGAMMQKLRMRWNILIVIALFLAQLWTFSFWLVSDELSF